MKGFLRMVILVMIATIAMGAAGCSLHYDLTDASKYYELPSAPDGDRIALDVPYQKFDAVSGTVDTVPIMDALREVYGADKVVFVSGASRRVDVKSVKIYKPWGYVSKCWIVADFEARELTPEYGKIIWSNSAENVIMLYRGATLDLAKQVKAITDAEALTQK